MPVVRCGLLSNSGSNNSRDSRATLRNIKFGDPTSMRWASDRKYTAEERALLHDTNRTERESSSGRDRTALPGLTSFAPLSFENVKRDDRLIEQVDDRSKSERPLC
jgi:hypothetical protein